ncbi:Biotin carboxyl carrier protein of acetyl-CoA carboxylase 1, chloroplastic [Ananas comosus]|uniref:Biotin carboxyl carrier protein of acetyl-CoA carboxylase n=1 Tax=Ananas comosus TaxID=4615 RepID=A0A199VHF9_ANACO|nr:Biotin carboxyl carrier protein of acetyl-CoA carboxylase 1, chloroplastic [Ananas comosus]
MASSSSSLPATVSASSASSSAAAAAAAPPRRRFAGLGIRCRRSTTAKAQLNEVRAAVGDRFRIALQSIFVILSVSPILFLLSKVVGDDSGASKPKEEEEVPTSEESNSGLRKRNSPPSPLPDEAISAFMSQVASLVKLVDSRDIIELQLKQLDCELIIRKKEALPQPQPAPVVMMQPPSAPAAMPSPVAASVPSPARASSAPPAAPALAQKAAKPSHPPLKSPMTGTFYRSPGPGQPPFVKPGDKVNKGQVLCIIEAMKLMNEIEADHAGTVVEILVDDGKPVGIDQPLFVIEP